MLGLVAAPKWGNFRRWKGLHAILFLLAGGCTGAEMPTDQAAQNNLKQVGLAMAPAETPQPSSEFFESTKSMGGVGGGLGRGRGSSDTPAADTSPKSAMSRKILYTATIDLVAEDLSKLETKIVSLVRESGGYIADTDMSGATGNSPTARWKLRIPIDKFDGFIDSAAKLGELARRQVNSQDVSEEYYDLETRIKNKKVEEARLLKHLQDTTAKLEDILAAEKELSRVREEVERQEGRLRLLANLSTLTTVTIQASEHTKFEPATAPTFSTRVSRTLTDSTKGFVEFVQWLLLLLVSVIPWLPVWLIGGVIFLLVYRRVRRRVIEYLNRPRPATS